MPASEIESGVPHWLRQRSGKVIMKILLQSKTTGNYVGCGGGWTWKLGRARVFPTGLEAIMSALIIKGSAYRSLVPFGT